MGSIGIGKFQLINGACLLRNHMLAFVSAVIVVKYRMMSRGKMSLIWEFYSVGEDAKFAVCSACGHEVGQTRESTVSDWLSVSTDICWYISD